MDGMFTSDEAASYLGISVPSLYVYVSRGLLESHRERGSRRSYYAIADVQRLASRNRVRSASARNVVSQIATVRPHEVRYRGEPIAHLVNDDYEQVAEFLWAAAPGGTAPGGVWAHRAFPVGKRLSPVDQVRSAVVLAGSADRFRSDLRPEAVLSAARSLIAGTARTLARAATPAPGPELIGSVVASALCGGAPSPELVRAVNAVMIVLADHAMSASTIAVRLAASTRTDLYSAVLAGLGVLSGPYYGGGSGAAAQLVRNAADVGVERAVDEQLRWRGPLPGFGIPGYPNGDPRFKAVFPIVERMLSDEHRTLVNRLLSCVAHQNFPPPGIDLALALLVHATGADPAFGPAIFGLSRIAGWTAHYAEELQEPVNRYLPPVVAPEGKTLPPLPRITQEPDARVRSIRRSGMSHSTATAAKKATPR